MRFSLFFIALFTLLFCHASSLPKATNQDDRYVELDELEGKDAPSLSSDNVIIPLDESPTTIATSGNKVRSANPQGAHNNPVQTIFVVVVFLVLGGLLLSILLLFSGVYASVDEPSPNSGPYYPYYCQNVTEALNGTAAPFLNGTAGPMNQTNQTC